MCRGSCAQLLMCKVRASVGMVPLMRFLPHSFRVGKVAQDLLCYTCGRAVLCGVQHPECNAHPCLHTRPLLVKPGCDIRRPTASCILTAAVPSIFPS